MAANRHKPPRTGAITAATTDTLSKDTAGTPPFSDQYPCAVHHNITGGSSGSTAATQGNTTATAGSDTTATTNALRKNGIRIAAQCGDIGLDIVYGNIAAGTAAATVTSQGDKAAGTGTITAATTDTLSKDTAGIGTVRLENGITIAYFNITTIAAAAGITTKRNSAAATAGLRSTFRLSAATTDALGKNRI